ncbi:MAG: phage holin family protein [Caldilineaceae bacterium]
MGGFLAVWLVTAISLVIMSSLSLGIEVKNFSSSLIAALVIGLLNAVLRPVLGFLFFPVTFLTLGLFALVLNGAMIWLAAQFVDGFRLRGGFLTAILAAIILAILNAIIFWIF